MRATTADRMVDGLLIAFFLLVGCLMLFPFLNVLSLSLLPEHIAARPGKLVLFPSPQHVTFAAYRYLFSRSFIVNSFLNSVFITMVGAVLGLLATAMLAYGLSDTRMPGYKVLSRLVLFTMMFSGGIIPSYLLVRGLHLLNTLWSLIIPSLISAYNVILMRAFFLELPPGLLEAAEIDGATHVSVLFRVVLPLSAPILATIALFYAVGKWNLYFDAVIYITDSSKKVLQVILREVLIEDSSDTATTSHVDVQLGVNVKMAVAVLSIVPIVSVYPFLQKHFAKGIMIGAVKG